MLTVNARVLIVSGSAHPDSPLQTVVAACAEVLHDARAELRICDLATLRLPILEFGNPNQAQLVEVDRVRTDAHWAQGFFIVTPEYHGNMSGALKNWFDFLYREFAGKLAAVAAVTGGGSGDMSIAAVKTSFAWCHGFTLPFHVAVRPDDFAPSGVVPPRIVTAKINDRLARMAHDVVRYAPLVHGAFERARPDGVTPDEDPKSGVAGLHPGKETES